MRYWRMINMDNLEYWLSTPTDDIFRELGITGNPFTRSAFIDNGADVLAVAHLDTVQKLSGIKKRVENTIYAHGLDDRLGAFAITNLLPYRVDWLFTDHEEVGRSTAQYFEVPKDYRYCMQFDRCGVDVVTYDLDSPEFLSDIRKAGGKLGWGSYTDLCYLDTNICCVNFGTGYYKPHDRDSFADLDELLSMVAISAEFNAIGKSYRQVVRDRSVGFYWDDNPIQSDLDYNANFCCICGDEQTLDFDWPVCEVCEGGM
jgi:hypothetical protein